MEILHCSELIGMPWKDGGGITRSIALATCGAQTAWRLSRADVAQNGAFSSFPGLGRILTVASDTGMVLEHPGGELDADPWQPVHFGGELDVFARLKDGHLTDHNLMFDSTLCDGSVITRRAPLCHAINTLGAGITALHVLAVQPMLATLHLGAGNSVFLDATAQLNLGKDDAVLKITVRYLDQSRVITFSIAVR